MRISNRIKEAGEAMVNSTTLTGPVWRQRQINQIDTILVHRLDVKEVAEGLNAHILKVDIVALARLSRSLDAIANRLAYPLLILKSGTIEQGLSITAISPHGRKAWNGRAIGIAVEGDFREEEPTAWQIEALKWLLPRLFAAFCQPEVLYEDRKYPSLLGHGEAPGAHDGSKAPGRHGHCPGKYIDMQLFRTLCAQQAPPRIVAQDELAASGLII